MFVKECRTDISRFCNKNNTIGIVFNYWSKTFINYYWVENIVCTNFLPKI